MKVSLDEIWHFLKVMNPSQHNHWKCSLNAGNTIVRNISFTTMFEMKTDETYDTELLPSLFTFREILWQPNVFVNTKESLSPLNILIAFCDDTIIQFQEESNKVKNIYICLIKGIKNCCGRAIERLEKEHADVRKVLCEFRTEIFPIIKFFIYHPKNRLDYSYDAINRLNYLVKIMIMDFYGKYTSLQDPFWYVNGMTPSILEEKKEKAVYLTTDKVNEQV